MRLPLSQIVGPALTATMLLAFIILDAVGLRLQNPAPLFLIAVTFAGYVAGLRPALLSAALAIGFSVYFFAIPGRPFIYTATDQARLASIILGTIAIAVLTGILRERLVRAERDAAQQREATAAAQAGSAERRRVFDFLETAPVSVALTRGPEHIVEIANARFRAGAGGVDPIGRPLRAAFPQVDTAKTLNAIDRVFTTGEPVSIDELAVPYENSAGRTEQVYLNVVVAPSLDPVGRPEGVFLFAANVTEPVMARLRLQALLAHESAERDRLQQVLDQLPEGVTISDDNGTFTLRNRAAEQMFPWPDRRVDTVVANAEYLRLDGTPYPREDLPGARARRGEVVQGEELLVRVREPFHEVPILMSSVALRSADGTSLGTVSVFQDITHRKRQEAELAAEQGRLRDSEARLRATVNVALDALIAMDGSGRITEWNPSAEAMFGWKRADAVGQELAALIIPERYRATHRTGLRRFLETGQARVLGKRIEIEGLHADGHELPIELAISIVQTSAGQSFTAFLRDISARRRLEAVQTAALGEVRQALRLRDEFLSAAAHDLKTPLTAVRGHIQLIRRRFAAALEPRFAASFDEVDLAATKMADLIDELLDVARLQSGQSLTLDLQKTDLVALARAVVERAGHRATEHAIDINATEQSIVGSWDAARIERVLTNLVSNAVKYSPGKGAIVVTIARENDGAQEWALISVRDRGIGIPANELPQLFTRFYRGSNARDVEGTGIGLEAARRMVEQHGGQISVESVEGSGTTVTVRLPLERTS